MLFRSSGFRIRNRLWPTLRVVMHKCGSAQRNAIPHEQLKDYEAVGSLISDHVIQEHAKNIVQQKGKEALGLNKDRESNNDLNFGYTWLKTFK